MMHYSFVAFLLGLGTRLQVQLIGFLPLTEIFVLLATPVMLRRMTSREALAPTRMLLPLAFLWLLGTAISDIYNQTDWSLSARGIARVVVFICCIPFCSWYLATDAWRKLFWFSVGVIPSAILSAFVLKGGVHEYRETARGGLTPINWETHWCILPYAICLVFMLMYYRTKPGRGYLAGLSAGVLNIYMGSRSIGAATILGAAITAARNALARRIQRSDGIIRRMTMSRAVLVSVVAAGVGLAILSAYSWAASSDLLGTRARLKYDAQARSRFGLLIAGRADVLGGLLAIKENPIFGYGSWPLDKQGFYVRMCELIGEKPQTDYYSRGYPGIPTHSHIIQGWVQGGFLGGLFWSYVLYVLIVSLYNPMLHETQLRLWATTVATNTIWVVTFSPISDRFMTSLVLALLVREMAAVRSPALAQISRRNAPPMGAGRQSVAIEAA